MKRVPCLQSHLDWPSRRCLGHVRPDFTGKRPNIRQQLHLNGAKGLPHRPAPAQPRSTQHQPDPCPGKAGLVVLISEDDLRETVSVGRNRDGRRQGAGRREPGSAPFNSTAHTVEWRIGGRQAVRDHSALA